MRVQMPKTDRRPRRQIAPELAPLHSLLADGWRMLERRPHSHPNASRLVGFQHLRSLAQQLYADGWRVSRDLDRKNPPLS